MPTVADGADAEVSLPSPSEEFLAELEDGLSRRLPAADIPVRLAEIAAHLDDATESCAEMGWEESVAVRTMGCPRQLASRLAKEATAHWDHRRLYLAAVAMAGFGLNYAGISVFGLPWLTKVVAVLSVAATFGIAFCAFRARGSRPIAIFGLGLALAIPMTIMHTALFVNMAYPGGRGNLPRRYVESRRAHMAEQDDLYELNRMVAEPFLAQSVRQAPYMIAQAAGLVAIVGTIDLLFGGMGLTAVALRRRRGRVPD